MKATLSLVGSYMCKNPPVVVFQITDKRSEKELVKRYLFNTPADIQRNLQGQFVRLNGSQTIMFTKFSHDVLTGMVNLILTLFDYQKHTKFLKLQFYGTQRHYDYFQSAKFHLGQKVYGISYATWMKPEYYRMGIVDEGLYEEILRSDKFSNFVWRINWRLEGEKKEKVNDAREWVKRRGKKEGEGMVERKGKGEGKMNEWYEDQYMVIRPFFQGDPAVGYKVYRNSPTHYLCVVKNQGKAWAQVQASTQQNVNSGQKQVQQVKQIKEARKATLIITYQSVEQMKKILERSDKIDGLNDNMGLLEFIESNITQNQSESNNTNNSSSLLPPTHLQTITHIIQHPQLMHSQQFHLLFNHLDTLSRSSLPSFPSSPSSPTHLFYGYGLKTPTTTIHQLLNTYYKGIRFYSICSKLFHFIPNITLNHLGYWSQVFEKEFVDVCKRVEQISVTKGERKGKGSFVEVYKPVHKLTLCGGSEVESRDTEVQDTHAQYTVPQSLLTMLKHPLFSTASQYRPSQQLMNTFQRESTYYQYAKSRTKTKATLNLTKVKRLKEFNPKVIFLGTNSKTPNELRNVSGILIEIPHLNNEHLLLLDCGAGTYEQFIYHYSPEEFERKLMALKVVFLTHLHADHNLGVLDLVKQRIGLMKERGIKLEEHKLYVIMPFNTFSWFYGYCKTVENIYEGCDIMFTQTLTNQKINLKDEFFESKRCQINIQRLKLSPGKIFGTKTDKQQTQNFQSRDYYDRYIKRYGSFQDYVKTLPDNDTSALKEMITMHGYNQQFIKADFDRLMKDIKIKKFLPSKVFHCPFSFGIVIEHDNGTKISYSGDCRPTKEFLEQASKSTLLIHEATYETNRQEKAISRLHSTFHEAVQAGLTSNSEHVCLTHFTPGAFDRDLAQACHSSMYKPEVLKFYRKNGIIACDHFEFKLSEMQEAAKASKIISHIGTNTITEKNVNPFTAKYIIANQLSNQQKAQEKLKQQDEEQVVE